MATGGTQTDHTDAVTDEKHAAVALAGFARSASEAGLPLPKSTASRKQWDREQAAPPDHGVAAAAAAAAGPGVAAFRLNPATAAVDSNHTPELGAAAGPPKTVLPTTTGMADRPWPQQHHYDGHPNPEHPNQAQASTLTATGHNGDSSHLGPQALLNSNNSNPSAVLMSMKSIGFGVAPASSADATEAAIRAVQDSMERSAIRLPTNGALRAQLTIHIKLGVPPRPTGAPMHVDVSRLSLFLPQTVPLLPVEIVVGGLLIDHQEIEGAPPMDSLAGTPVSNPNPMICTAVACVTLQQSQGGPATEAESHATMLVTGQPVGGPVASGSPWAPLEQQTVPPPQHRRTASQPAATGYHQAAPTGSIYGAQAHKGFNRTNSMEVLAQISGEKWEKQFNGTISTAPGSVAVHDGGQQQDSALAMVCSAEAKSLVSRGSEADMNNSAYSYKKLAPGMTPKNNKRLFVRHEYRDYSREEPLPEERFLLRSDTRTPNAAFPLKLHETLTQIEQDGYSHIIGWMPHGRSFKIHQQQEFVDVVLPKYFVMTKKSSFLRQLNLYAFNRISVGPDSGSYYHEKFLRGLKFLCRRMSRQKVNGNGIRAAGNPDEEPSLNSYPSCPPSSLPTNGGTHGGRLISASPENGGGEPEPSDSSTASPSRSYNGADNPPSLLSSFGNDGPKLANGNNTNGVESSSKKAQSRGSRVDNSSGQVSFPLKLQRILDKAEADGKTDIISWLPHGRAFLVHDVDRFVSEIMGQYFNQTKYSSFQRQLHMYCFQRITFGRDKGAYHHEKFHRGRPDLCMTMVRTRVNGKGCRRPGDPDNEPDFYEMPAVPHIPPGTIVELPLSLESPLGNDDDDDQSDMQVESCDGSAVAV